MKTNIISSIKVTRGSIMASRASSTKPTSLFALRAWLFTLVLIGASVLITGSTARAATALYWDTSTSAGMQPGGGTWDAGTTAMWSSTNTGSNPLVTWVSGDAAIFYNSGNNGIDSPAISGTITADSIQMISNSMQVSITGGTLIISGTKGVQNTGNNALSISSAVILGTGTPQNYSLYNNSATGSQYITLSGPVSENGQASLTISAGPSNVGTVLSGSNSFSGGVTLTGGQFGINNNNALGSGTLTITGGIIDSKAAIVTASNAQTWSGNYGYQGTYALNFTGPVVMTGSVIVSTTANTLTDSGNITESGAGGYTLTKAGPGTLVLAGTNTYRNTTVSGGFLSISSTSSLPSLGTTTTVSSSAGLVVGNSVTLQNLNTIAGNATVNSGGYVGFDTTAGNRAESGAITIGADGLVKYGANTLTLSGNSTYTGASYIYGGTLAFTNAVTVGAGGGVASNLGESGNAAANLLLGNGTVLQYTGAGGSTDRLFTVYGTTTGNSATVDASGSGPINFTNAGSVAWGTTGQTRTLILQGTNTGLNILSAAIGNNGGGAVAVTKSGAGTWVLNGNNTFSGLLEVTQGGAATPGTLILAGANNAGGTGTNGIQFGSGGTGNANKDAGNLTFDYGQAVTYSTVPTVTSNHGGAQGSAQSNIDTLTFDAPNSATAGYTQNLGRVGIDQDATLVINQTANYSGQVVVNFSGASFLGTSTNGGQGSALIVNGAAVSISNLNLVGAGGANSTYWAIGGSGTGNAITGPITSSGLGSAGQIFHKYGTGSWTFSGANTYATQTVVDGGTLELDYSSQDNSKLSGTAALTMNGGALQLNGGTYAQAVGSLTLTSTAQNSITHTGGGTSTIALGAITFSSGAIDFTSGVATTTTANAASGILTARATVGQNDWASSGSSGTNSITAYSGYNTTWSSTSPSSASNYALNDLGLLSVSGTVNTLKVSADTTGQSLAINNNITLALGANGLLFPGSNTNAYSITTGGGTSQIKAAAGNIILQDWGTGVLTLGAIGSSLDKYGTGKTILSASSQAATVVSVYAGSLQYSADNQLSNAGATAMNLNGSYGNAALIADTTNGSIITNRAIALGVQGGNYIDVIGSHSVTLSGSISGSVYVNLNATPSLTTGGFILNLGGARAVDSVNNGTTNGTIILQGANTYNGATSLNAGTVELNRSETPGTSGPLGAGGNISFNGGTLEFSSSNSYDYSSRIFNSTSAISINTNGTNVIFASPISNTNVGGLTLNDTNSTKGSLTLSASSSYGGTTTVTAGKLIVSGSLTGTTAATVASAATLQVDGLLNTGATATVNGILQGKGTLGTVNVNNLGTLSPGNAGSGNLTVSDLTLASGANLAITINGNLNSTNVTNSAASGASISGAHLNLTTTYAPSNTGLLATTDHIILTLGGGVAITGQFSNTTTLAGDPYYGSLANVVTDNNGNEWAVFYNSDYNGSNDALGNIELYAVPEPQTLCMILSGFGMLIGFQRLRKIRVGTR